MLTLHSPAKINLFLKIVHRRPDGYHELASLFQALSLRDEIHYTLHSSDQLSCSDPSLPTDSSNLILKAVNLFRQKTGLLFNVKVHLEKKIPYEAGLGGGSSNAATTLWALNELLEKPVTETELSAWSSEIGSDIPFFFSSGTAYCIGRGECVRSLNPLPQTSLWIVKPQHGLSTPAVYRRVNLDKLSSHNPEQVLSGFIAGAPCYFNDLEIPALSLLPSLATLRTELLDLGFKDVLLAGSGSSFFCIGPATPPHRPDLFCAKVNYLNRTSGHWY